MSDPTDQLHQEELARRTNFRVDVYVASHSEVNAILDHQHRRQPLIRDVAKLHATSQDDSVESIDAAALVEREMIAHELEALRPLFQVQEITAQQLQIIFELCVEKGLVDREEYFRRLAAAPD
jgi:hypothetical protein